MTVAEWMEQKSMAVEGLLAATRLERRVLEAIIQGRYTPSPVQRERIAAALNVPIEELSFGHANPVSHLYGHGPQFGRTP